MYQIQPRKPHPNNQRWVEGLLPINSLESRVKPNVVNLRNFS
ncbi:MAG TPA: hypothetical protein VJ201_06485 [Candidatus Babeliales bacterium]|nr:hypothetical protein [Candidatus Babeliales bacterium]